MFTCCQNVSTAAPVSVRYRQVAFGQC